MIKVFHSAEYSNESERIPAGTELILVRAARGAATLPSKIQNIPDLLKCKKCNSVNDKLLKTTCCNNHICEKCSHEIPSYNLCPFCKKAGEYKEDPEFNQWKKDVMRIMEKETGATSTYPDDIGPSDPLYNFLIDPRFFIIKSVNKENIDIAQQKNLWATTIHNQTKLSEAYRVNKNVILIFSMNKSQCYQGIAKMSSDIGERDPSPFNPPMCAKLGGGFGLYWIIKGDLPYSRIGNINNPLNQNEPIKKCRDT